MLLPTLELTRRGRVLEVRIANPDGDLLDASVMADLDLLGRRLADDASIGAVILTGPRPGTFVPHYDIEEIVAGAQDFSVPTSYPVARGALAAVKVAAIIPGAWRALSNSPAAGLVQMLRTQMALRRLGLLPQVVIAAIDGDALGGGCELALACDIRVMTDADYRIGLPEISAGIMPGAGGTQRLAAAVGARRARAMVLQARTVDPREALHYGLVDEICDDAVVRAHEIAVRVAQWNPDAVRNAKRALPGWRGFTTEAAGFVATVSHRPAIEKMQEFVAQPRSPWQSRAWTS